jgi:hypothetical protein
LLHFSGHGLKSESGELFFAASNTRPNRLGSTAFSADFVQRCMRDSRSRSIVLLLDCCYGGAFAQGVKVRAAGDVSVLDSFPQGRSGGGRGRAVITASSAMEFAFEGDQLGDDQHRRPSVFTAALVEGLATGEADRDEDGWVSLDELYDYVFDKVREQNPYQTPGRVFELEGELYLARSRRRRILAAPIPPDLQAALADPNMFTRLGVVSELRSRLASDNMAAAAGAYEALAQLVGRDISYVARPAAEALSEAAVHPAQTELHFGRIEQGSAPPHRRVRLLGPPIARACVPRPSHDWIRVHQTAGRLDISIDTAGMGILRGSVGLKGPTGEAVIAIEINLVSPSSQTPPVRSQSRPAAPVRAPPRPPATRWPSIRNPAARRLAHRWWSVFDRWWSVFYRSWDILRLGWWSLVGVVVLAVVGLAIFTLATHRGPAAVPVGDLLTNPAQQPLGVSRQIVRVAAAGNTIVTTGSQASGGVVRQQFYASADGGATWYLARTQLPGGGRPPAGQAAARIAGGAHGWLAEGPKAIWTSQDGLSWTLAAAHGISPQLSGDNIEAVTGTADGFLAAGWAGNAGGNQAVIWISRDGKTWQRLTATQLGLLTVSGRTPTDIQFATSRGNDTLVSDGSSVWLSTDGGTAWTQVPVAVNHGASNDISGLSFDGSGLIALRPGTGASGAPDGVAYFSPNGREWKFAGLIDPAGGWTPTVVKGSDYGFVVVGTATDQYVAYLSTGTGATWRPTESLGSTSDTSIQSATVGSGGTVIAVGSAGQHVVFIETRPEP